MLITNPKKLSDSYFDITVKIRRFVISLAGWFCISLGSLGAVISLYNANSSNQDDDLLFFSILFGTLFLTMLFFGCIVILLKDNHIAKVIERRRNSEQIFQFELLSDSERIFYWIIAVLAWLIGFLAFVAVMYLYSEISLKHFWLPLLVSIYLFGLSEVLRKRYITYIEGGNSYKSYSLHTLQKSLRTFGVISFWVILIRTGYFFIKITALISYIKNHDIIGLLSYLR